MATWRNMRGSRSLKKHHTIEMAVSALRSTAGLLSRPIICEPKINFTFIARSGSKRSAICSFYRLPSPCQFLFFLVVALLPIRIRSGEEECTRSGTLPFEATGPGYRTENWMNWTGTARGHQFLVELSGRYGCGLNFRPKLIDFS